MTLLTKLRRFCVLGVIVAAAFIAVAPSALAQPANIDVYEHRTSPVPHRTSMAGSATRTSRSRCLTAGMGSCSSAHADSPATSCRRVRSRQSGSEGLCLRAQRPGLVPLRHHRQSRGQVLRVASSHPAAHELHEVDGSPLLRRAGAHVHGGRL